LAGTQNKMKILLAEDSALSRKLALKMIEHCGHDADSAEDGRQAVEKACSCSYDLILMDMFMPGLDGGEAALEIRSKGASTPIVALCAVRALTKRLVMDAASGSRGKWRRSPRREASMREAH